MARKDRLVYYARLAQILLATTIFIFAVIKAANDGYYSPSPYMLASGIYASVGVVLCGVLGMVVSSALQGFADHDFYSRLHPLLLMLILECMALAFDFAATVCITVGATQHGWNNIALWVVPIACGVICMIVISFLLFRTARIWWRGTVSSAIAERVAREEQDWYAQEAGQQSHHKPEVDGESIARTVNGPELQHSKRTSLRSQPLSTVHTELSGPRTLATGKGPSILSASSHPAPSYASRGYHGT